jgi:hypothetical protein
MKSIIFIASLIVILATATITASQSVTALKDGKSVYNTRNHLVCEGIDTPEIECKSTSGYVANGVTPDTHENENFNDNRGDTYEDRCKENSHSVPNAGSENNGNDDDGGESFCDPDDEPEE